MIIQPSFGGCLRHRIAIPFDKNRPSAVAFICGLQLPLIKPPSIGMRQRAVHRKKTILHWHAPTVRCIAQNRRSAVSYVSTGLARLPRDTSGTRNYRRRAVVARCYAYGYKESAPRIAPRGAS